jgi:CRISPR/Cas system-associated endoribonuclease Cas2
MLNRVREAKHTEADLEKLRERVRPYGHSDLGEVALYIVCTRMKCAKINREYLDSHPGNDILIKARHFHPTQQNFKPRLCKKEGTVGNSSFMDQLRVKIGCKIILIHNIDTADGLTNGQLGKLLEVIRSEDGSIAKVIIEFKNENAGKQNRAKNIQFSSKYPRGTVIEKVSFSYSLSKKATAGSSRATVIQFPLKVAHAITAHKIQGQTIPKPLKVALDISSIFEDAQAHVMLTRVEEFQQIYILESLPEDKIRASSKALAELGEMNSRSINQNPIIWKRQNTSLMKICSLNCMNLSNNFDEIIYDNTLKESTLLALSETWLDQQNTFNINGYKAHYNSIGPGKGLALYYKSEIFKPGLEIKEVRMQISKLESKELDVIIVYRSEQGNLTDLVEHMKKLINIGVNTVVTGDFNICYFSNRNNKITKYLENEGFSQLMNEPTHTKGRHLDHLYFRPGKNPVGIPSIYRYSPYYSDHDAICATIQLTETEVPT